MHTLIEMWKHREHMVHSIVYYTVYHTGAQYRLYMFDLTDKAYTMHQSKHWAGDCFAKINILLDVLPTDVTISTEGRHLNH